MTTHPSPLGRWWTATDDGRFRCELCPRLCTLRPGQRGFCYVRSAHDDGIHLETWGRSSGFCVDPIEKKPLNQFLPGTPVLSFGTAGCNLGCRFCQNWDISKAKADDRLMDTATPAGLVDAALRTGSRSIAFTYNDPVIFAEYALDVAEACRAADIRTVAVTAGYITERARPEFFAAMDAANIDLKAFTDEFYRKLCFAELGPVLQTIDYAVNQADTWVEITTLLIEGSNDSDDEITQLSRWVADHLGPDVPLHFTAFHPDFKMRDRAATSLATVTRARDIARDVGLRFVYTGNVHDPEGGSTWCPACGELLIERDWYELGTFRVEVDPEGHGACGACGNAIPGQFDPAGPGTWGRKRQPVHIGR